MTEIIQFVPQAECDAKENIQGFVDLCRNRLTVFGEDLDWDANIWDVSRFIPKDAINGRLVFSFSNHHSTGLKSGAEPMAQPFLDFAKAYMRYCFGLTRRENHAQKMAGVRALEKALVEHSVDGVPRVEKADAHAFNRAAQLVREKNPGSAYQSGTHLQKIAAFLAENRMTAAPLAWQNPIKRKGDPNIRVGEQADARRKAKLPTAAVLEALPKAFFAAREPMDIVVTSMAAIMLCAPDRISEVFRLPVNCEHRDRDSKGEAVYALRWWPSKGADPMLKWVVKSMAGVCEEAVRRIREQTEEARRIARWYEDNPGKLYLPKGLEHLRQQEYLSAEEIAEIIGFGKGAGGAYVWVRSKGIAPAFGTIRSGYSFRFKDVETAVVDMLPNDWPVCDSKTGLRYSEALIVVSPNFFHQKKGIWRCMIEKFSINMFNSQIGAAVQHGKSSVFSRMGFAEPDGSPIRITSHQFRHYLNTLAQRKNLDQVSIALWSGRKDFRQNTFYDHVTAEETLELIRQADFTSAIGPLAEILPNLPMSREEFLELRFPTVHTTEYGFCVHDWSMVPCQKHRACIDCTEHLCVKGDREKTERVRSSLADAEAQLQRDEEALAEGVIGADRWFEHNRAKVDRLRNLLTILDNPDVPPGTIIQLTNANEYSPIGIAVDDRRQLGDTDAEMLNRIRALAG